MRLYITFRTNQAAFDYLMLKRVMNNEVSNAEWESRVVSFGYLHWRRSIWFGEWFQRLLLYSIKAGLQYLLAAASEIFERHSWQ